MSLLFCEKPSEIERLIAAEHFFYVNSKIRNSYKEKFGRVSILHDLITQNN